METRSLLELNKKTVPRNLANCFGHLCFIVAKSCLDIKDVMAEAGEVSGYMRVRVHSTFILSNPTQHFNL